MATTVWKGHLTFGLVAVPVRFVRAARAEHVKLRQLYRPREATRFDERESNVIQLPKSAEGAPGRDGGTRGSMADITPFERPEPAQVAPVRRVYQSASASEDEEPIAPADLTKGYEYSKGEYVVLEEDELRALAPKTSTELAIAEFVRFEEIDPVYLETSYYVTPDESGEKAYALLFQAMQQTGYAAVGHVTMHRRDHVVIVRPGKSGLIAHTMFYPDEVRSTQEFRTDTSVVVPKQLELAENLIRALAKPFDPSQFKNEFRQRLEELIEGKLAGRQIARSEPAKPAPVIDIMEALKRSLAQVKTAAAETAEPQQTHRKPAAGERKKSSGRTAQKKQR